MFRLSLFPLINIYFLLIFVSPKLFISLSFSLAQIERCGPLPFFFSFYDMIFKIFFDVGFFLSRKKWVPFVVEFYCFFRNFCLFFFFWSGMYGLSSDFWWSCYFELVFFFLLILRNGPSFYLLLDFWFVLESCKVYFIFI